MSLEVASWIAGIIACLVSIVVAVHQVGREKLLKSIALLCFIGCCLFWLWTTGVLSPRPQAVPTPASEEKSTSLSPEDKTNIKLPTPIVSDYPSPMVSLEQVKANLASFIGKKIIIKGSLGLYAPSSHFFVLQTGPSGNCTVSVVGLSPEQLKAIEAKELSSLPLTVTGRVSPNSDAKLVWIDAIRVDFDKISPLPSITAPPFQVGDLVEEYRHFDFDSGVFKSGERNEHERCKWKVTNINDDFVELQLVAGKVVFGGKTVRSVGSKDEFSSSPMFMKYFNSDDKIKQIFLEFRRVQ